MRKLVLCLSVCAASCWGQITFNNSADLSSNGGTTNSLSTAYTVGSGGNRLLAVCLVGDTPGGGHDDITSVTQTGGCTLSLAVKSVAGTQNRFAYLYWCVNPASGSHNININATGTHFLLAGAADYAGVNQSGQPDSTASQVSGSSVTSLTTSITTASDKSWAVLCHESANTSGIAAGSGAFLRTSDAAHNTWGLFDSNSAITPAGSYSMTTTQSTPSVIVQLLAPFSQAPLTPGSIIAGPNLFAGPGTVH
jgi:hypothetical protein